jgi:FemAB-related protein (PEP-CTERM system-associated)
VSIPGSIVAESRRSDLTVAPWEGDPRLWDAFVREADGATFCHLSAWQEIIGGVLGHECLHAAALSASGELVGMLPLVRVRSRIFGHYLVSMPFLNAGGPLGPREARERLVAWAVEQARRSRADLLELRSRDDVAPGLVRSDRKVTVVLPLPATAEALWNETFRSKLRSQIRRAQKAGMEARFGPDQAEAFYEVFARNMRDLGTPVLPWRFFEAIRKHFEDSVVFAAVYRRGEPVAGGCGFAFRGAFELTWASSLRRYAPEAPNMLLYWSLMEHAIARGIEVFDFGRCTPGSGTHRFKLQWGGADEPLPWSQWSARGLTAPPTPDRPVYRVAGAVWRRLPLAVTRAVGPLLARSLP